MIPVQPQPEPASFDARVRQKGLAHLRKHGYSPDQPLPPETKIEPYWRNCLSELHRAYSGICAYLCVHIERVTGGSSVDHYIAKSTARADLAYEWSNYRLACTSMNSRKRDYSDVLDPFTLAPGMFFLELATGHIYPNPNLAVPVRQNVANTIERLGLDKPECRELRARWYQEYFEQHISSEYLHSKSPFVWQEAHRQALL